MKCAITSSIDGAYSREGHQEIEPLEVKHLESPSKLKWNLTNKVKEAIQQSAADLDR